MTTQISGSGGIYIEIGGDYSQLKKDLDQVRAVAKANSEEISKSLTAALSPKHSENIATNLTRSLVQAQAAAKSFGADITQVEKRFRTIGDVIKVSENELENFVKLQSQAFRNQAAEAFKKNLRSVQKLTGATNEEMNRLAKSMGGVGNEFDKAGDKASKAGASFGACLKGLEGVGIAARVYFATLLRDAVEALARMAKESFELALRYETLGVVVQQVGRVAGYSAIEIDKCCAGRRARESGGASERRIPAGSGGMTMEEESYLFKWCWYNWIGGLLSALISSAASGVVLCIAAPEAFNLEQWPLLLKTAVVFGILGAATYLKDFPGPKPSL